MFSKVSWRKPTQSYLKLINNRLDDIAMEVIMNEAKEFAWLAMRRMRCKMIMTLMMITLTLRMVPIQDIHLKLNKSFEVA